MKIPCAVVAALCGVFCANIAWAQEVPRGEIALGFPMVHRYGSGQVLGAEVTGGVNVNKWLGLCVQLDSYLGEVLSEAEVHTMLAGPVLSYRATPRSRVFVRTLFGAANSRFSSPRNVTALAYGGGIDLGRRRAFRATLDGLTTRFYSHTQTFRRLSVGIVFPLGAI